MDAHHPRFSSPRNLGLPFDNAQLGAVDATQHQNLAQKYGVQGYPTIKAFPPGPKKGPQDYNGPRESAGIVDYATEVSGLGKALISFVRYLRGGGVGRRASLALVGGGEGYSPFLVSILYTLSPPWPFYRFPEAQPRKPL